MTPVSIPWSSVAGAGKDFQQGGPLYGQQLTAQEFRKRLEAMK